MANIISSKIITPDGTLLQSFTKHDYKEHKDLNGETYGIDGGNDYQRIIGNIEDLEIITITDEDDYEVIRQELYWGTYGKDGKDPFKWIYLNEMSDEHIQNVLHQIGSEPTNWRTKFFKKELEYRKENNISIKD